MDIKIEIAELTMDTIVSGDYHQTGEEDWAREPITLGEAVTRQVVSTLIPQEVKSDLARVVRDVRAEVIREALEPIVTEAIAQGIQQTNTYGEPTGKTTTLRELIIAEVQKVVTKPANSYGRKPTLLQKIVTDTVECVVRKEMEEAMKAEKDKAVAAVRAKGAEIIADVVTKGLRSF